MQPALKLYAVRKDFSYKIYFHIFDRLFSFLNKRLASTEIAKISVSELSVRQRIRNLFSRHKIKSIGNILSFSTKKLKDLKNFGDCTILETQYAVIQFVYNELQF